MTIGEALRRFRAEFKLKQEEVAGVLGLTRQAYYFYETGKAMPPAQKIVELSKAYNVTTDYLLGRSDSPRPMTIDKDWLSRLTASRDLIQSILRDSGQGIVAR